MPSEERSPFDTDPAIVLRRALAQRFG